MLSKIFKFDIKTADEAAIQSEINTWLTNNPTVEMMFVDNGYSFAERRRSRQDSRYTFDSYLLKTVWYKDPSDPGYNDVKLKDVDSSVTVTAEISNEVDVRVKNTSGVDPIPVDNIEVP